MTRSNVADLTTSELRKMVREVVIQTLSEILSDPDEGLELRDEFRVKLRRSLKAFQSGKKNIPARKVADKLGLTW